ncbi:MAG: NUDIX hydrolase [Bacteroidales bacterium]|nr:NUDIX hydrolase [Lachnoclostridium sp.]MCM1384142.1 NUDIX hydrolase [Lachnoclostridium sp.]MCM1464808.1 NUDIX hydrolase [Bacteroidales bacterium]
MSFYKMNEAEKEYLSHYDMSKYERPSVAADIVIFSILNDGISTNIRKLPKKALKVLLIKRANYPYKDCWALPGGFVKPGEDVAETARRKLYEETNVKNAYLQLVGTYGKKDRDPRGWIISNAFMALMDGEKCRLKAGADAWEAEWFNVKIRAQEIKKDLQEDVSYVETEYRLYLTNKEKGLSLNAGLKQYRSFQNYHETVRYEILQSKGLAFDHAEIILSAMLSLRNNIEHDLRQAFDLMPEMFTLTQLQNVFEIVLDRELLTANFRRKIADYVVETVQIVDGAGYRPPKLFKRNVEAFSVTLP